MGSDLTKDIKDEMCNHLQEKYMPNPSYIGRKAGKTNTTALFVEHELGSIVKAVKVCARIPFRRLPLNINHSQLKVRELVKWRLKRGV